MAQKNARSPARFGVLLLATVLFAFSSLGQSFVSGCTQPSKMRGSMRLHAEEKAGETVALVKVTPENQVTTASLLGGAAGLLLGGVWVGGALFAATSYLARRDDDDISKGLKGVASKGLEFLNFGSYLNEKYTVTGQIGTALSGAIKDTPLDTVAESINSVDKDVGIKNSIGNLVSAASDMAGQAVETVVELNDEYKVTQTITDKVKETIDEVTKSK